MRGSLCLRSARALGATHIGSQHTSPYNLKKDRHRTSLYLLTSLLTCATCYANPQASSYHA